jgi:hypothetical protein
VDLYLIHTEATITAKIAITVAMDPLNCYDTYSYRKG